MPILALMGDIIFSPQQMEEPSEKDAKLDQGPVFSLDSFYD